MAPVLPARAQGRAAALPSGRAGRLLASALLLLALALLWLAIGAPLLDLYRRRAVALDGRQVLAAHMAELAARLPALRRDAAAARLRSGPAALIAGGSDAIAGAALQDQVQQMASALGATLSSSETLPAAPAGNGAYRRVGVRIAVTAPFDVMTRLVAAIEQASPAMLIDDLQLHGPRIQLTADAPLEGAMTVLAFRRAGAGDASPAASPVASSPDDAVPGEDAP